jgi:hypothetical protein
VLFAQTAEYVQKVAQRDRLYRAYYRVAFFGSGFEEEAVAGKEFVYVTRYDQTKLKIRFFCVRIRVFDE